MQIILDFKFQGLTYIIVYVGAIAILFQFVIKMTDTGRSPLNPISGKRGTNNKGKNYVLILSVLLGGLKVKNQNMLESLESGHIYNYFISSYSSEFVTYTDIESLGYILYLGYPLITILIGILLQCVQIGILKISRKS